MCKCEGWILQELRPEVEKIIHSIAFSIEGHIEDEKVKQAFEDMKPFVKMFYVIGSYHTV